MLSTFLKALSGRGLAIRGRLPTEERLMTPTIQELSRHPLPVAAGNGQTLASRWLTFTCAVVALAIAGFAGNANAADVYLQCAELRQVPDPAGFKHGHGPDVGIRDLHG